MAEHTGHGHESRAGALGARWLGIGLASMLAIVTLVLGFTGRLTLYIAPETVWFACAGAIVVLAGAVWSCALPLGSEREHGHDHGEADAAPRRAVSVTAAVVGGILASAVAVAALVLPPASLSVELAMERADTAPPLFAGADDITLGVADTSTFQLGDWAGAIATATRPESYDGASVDLVGFVTPGDDGTLDLTRMVITHCVIDAQPASVPVVADVADYATGQWVEVSGTVRTADDGSLRVVPETIAAIDEPKDPYEY